MAVIGPALAAQLVNSSASGRYDVHIFGRNAPTREVVSELSMTDEESVLTQGELIYRIRERSQMRLAPVLGFLQGKLAESASSLTDSDEPPPVQIHNQFWINNSIHATASADVVRDLAARDDVAYVEIVRHATHAELIDNGATEALTDAPGGPTWSVAKINAPTLWAKGIDGEGVLIALIDTGVNYNHPDLAGRMWVNPSYPNHGWNFFDNNNDPMDAEGHGTACAGIVAGSGASGTETGVAPKATIMALRAGQTESSFWDALQFAIEHHADLISMSMTWKYDKQPNYPGWRRVCESVLAAGVLHANSSGNQGAQLSSYPIPWNVGAPGNCPSPLPSDPAKSPASPVTCGSTNNQDQMAFSSGQGPSQWTDAVFTDWPYPTGLIKPDVCAPGENTTSLNNNFAQAGQTPYSRFTGTSAATPNLGGALALLVHACKRAGQRPNPANVQRALEATAVRIAGQTQAKQNVFGAGRIDVDAAYQYGVTQGYWS